MKERSKDWLLVLALCFIAACGDDGEPASSVTASGQFLALSYNVAGLPEGISGSRPSVYMPQIAPLLNNYDLVLLQESWQTPDPNPLAGVGLRVYHEILVAGSNHPYKSEPLPIPLYGDPLRPSALVSDGLNRFSRLPFGEVIRRRWADCDNSAADCLSLKGFSVARTRVADDVCIDVYNLHMEAGSTARDHQLRRDGVLQFAAFMGEYSAGKAVIVGGDFNLHSQREPDATTFQHLLAETDLTDVCAARACPEPGRIDKFVFRSSAGVSVQPLSWRFETDVFVTSSGEPLSDHEALAVRFEWNARGPTAQSSCL